MIKIYNHIKYICSIIAICFAVLFNSCTKDETIKDETDSGSKVCYLKQVVESRGESESFFYDDDNRLIKITSSPETMSMTFTYGSDGHISDLLVEDGDDSNSISFIYDDEGMLVSAHSDNDMAEFKYEYENEKLVCVKAYDNIIFSRGTVLMSKTEFDYIGDNISEFREYGYNFRTGGLSLLEKVTYTHDDNKNPYAEMGISLALINMGYEMYASANNCISRNVVMSSYGDEIGSYELSFEYNEFGYPIRNDDGTSFIYYE